ncbi:MAG: LytR/AlgR family response regulator transcription factor [Saprospiraceae bacterium]
MKCIIIEDEVPAQEILIRYIEKVVDLELMGVYNSALKANTILHAESIDIIFLDINLPNISGINYIKTLKNPPWIIMTTAYTNYAVESFELDSIVDYLVKPFSFERFLKAINKLESRQRNVAGKQEFKSVEVISKDVDFIFINVDKILHKIDLNNIMYIESDRNYVTIVTDKVKLPIIDSLRRWSDYLNQDNFIRIHRSFIVNINYIEKVTATLVYINKQKMPVGKTYKEALFERVKPIN